MNETKGPTAVTNITSLVRRLDECGYDNEAVAKIVGWWAEGKALWVFENVDLGHHDMGNIVVCTARATGLDSPPKCWPFDATPVGPGWRYVYLTTVERPS